MMQAMLNPRNRGGPSISRYDERHAQKFDVSHRTIPEKSEYLLHQEYAKRHNLGNQYGARIAEGMVLASVNLQTRGLVGVVLGSTLKKIIDPPANIDGLNSHSDLDVLILNPHSEQNPAPHEWGIDWWVRPQEAKPTNGYVSLWYDLSLNPSIRTIEHESSHQIGIDLDVETEVTEYRAMEPEENGEVCQSATLSAGLYLPSIECVTRIIDHCNHTRAILMKRMEELREPTQMFSRTLYEKRVTIWKSIPISDRRDILLSLMVQHAEELENQIDAICSTFAVDIGFNSVRSYINSLNAEGLDLDYIQSKTEDHLERLHMSSLERMAEKPADFSYLCLEGMETRRALLPILPDSILAFSPYEQR